MRIVHAANLGLNKDGLHMHNQDQKIQHGLVRLGHFVYPFSVNDRARMLSPLGHKTFGASRTNTALIKTCETIRPDLLVLGHAQIITKQTLAIIRSKVAGIKICLWYIDPLWNKKDTRHIFDRLPQLDAVFCSTGGELLQEFSRPHCIAAFLPSAVDASVECHRAYQTAESDFIHDLIFFGSDRNEPERYNFLVALKEELKDLRLGFYGCLGNPPIFGSAKENILCRSKMALNLSRRSDVKLYSSCRIAELMGNGILTFTPENTGLDHLYSAEGIVYFKDVQSLATKAREFAKRDAARVQIAKTGHDQIHLLYSGTQIADFIVKVTYRDPSWRKFCWARHAFLVALGDRSEGIT